MSQMIGWNEHACIKLVALISYHNYLPLLVTGGNAEAFGGSFRCPCAINVSVRLVCGRCRWLDGRRIAR